jgi:hypothetical protein
VDQFLLNYLLGETNTLTAPVTELARTTLSVKVTPQPVGAFKCPSPSATAPVARQP